MTLKLNRIYNMDCLEGMRQMEDKSVDLVLCDLPYGQTQNKWDSIIPLEGLWGEYLRVCKQKGAVVLFGQGMFTADLMQSQKTIWRYNLVWDKGSCTGFLNSGKMPLRQHEDILIFYRELPKYNPQMRTGPKTHGRGKSEKTDNNYGEYNRADTDISLGHAKYPTSILKFNKVPPSDLIHPTQKPAPLCECLIKTYSDEGDLVLDNCMGSGTTAEACIRTGRQFIGFEKEQSYFDAAEKRIKRAKGQSKIGAWF